MATIIDNFNYLKDTKELMRLALNAKGANLTLETPFREYILAIEGLRPITNDDKENMLAAAVVLELLHLYDSMIINLTMPMESPETVRFMDDISDVQIQIPLAFMDGDTFKFTDSIEVFHSIDKYIAMTTQYLSMKDLIYHINPSNTESLIFDDDINVRSVIPTVIDLVDDWLNITDKFIPGISLKSSFILSNNISTILRSINQGHGLESFPLQDVVEIDLEYQG
jgi:hypothetical protein